MPLVSHDASECNGRIMRPSSEVTPGLETLQHSPKQQQ